MRSGRSFLVALLLLAAKLHRCTTAGVSPRDEYIWGHRDYRTERVCHSQSVVIEPTWEAFFSFFRPVTRLVSFVPPQPEQAVRYIRVWTDAPWHRFRAELVHGGVGTKAPTTTIIHLSRHWMLFANVVIYCTIP